MYSVTINKPVDVNVYKVMDQDGDELSIEGVKADRDGDLVVEVFVPNKQCQHCRCHCDE